MAGIRDLRLGRMQLPTIEEDITESVGDTLATVGGGVVAGERRARTFGVAIPIHGTPGDANPYTSGAQMRRQMRSLMENTRVKLLGIYLQFPPDDELNSWLLIGAGDLKYVNGGITTAEFVLTLSDCYKVGSKRSHRVARRIELYDRRLITTARDLLGQFFSTDYQALTALPLVYLPVGATDVTGAGKRVITKFSRSSLGGVVSVVVMPTSPSATVNHGEVLSFEQTDSTIHLLDDVVIYDRRGGSDPGNGYPARILNENLRGYWRLGEGQGATTALDSSENNNNGVYVGIPNPGLAPGIKDVDTATGLSGPDGSYVRVPNASTLQITGALSAEAWIKPLPGAANLVPNPSFEVDSFGWVQNNDANTTVTNFALSSVWSVYGLKSLRLQGTSTGSATSGARLMAQQSFNGVDAMPVLGSHTYSSRAEVNVTSIGALGVWLMLDWWDSAGVYINGQSGTAITGTGVKIPTLTVALPANAAFARLTVVAGVGTSGTVDVSIDGVTMVDSGTPAGYTDTRPRYDTIISKWRSTAGGRSYRFAYDSYIGEFVLELSTTGSDKVRAVSSGGVLLPSTWYQVGFSLGAGTAVFYRNGVAVSTATSLPTSIYSSTTQLAIGKWEADP